MANEVKKLMEMGIVTPQTKYLKKEESNSVSHKVITVEQSPKTTAKIVRGMKYKDGMMVLPPVAPEPIDTSDWKKMTAKRQGMLAEYRLKMREHLVAKAEYDSIPMEDTSKMDEIIGLQRERSKILREEDGLVLFEYPSPKTDTVVFEYPCGKGHHATRNNMRRELPYSMVEHHKAVFTEVTEGNWVTLENYDPVWRREEHDRMREWRRTHPKDFFKSMDTTVQLTLFNPGVRQVNEDVLHAFEDNPNLGFEYFLATLDGHRPCIHGSVNIKSEYIMLTPSQRDEINERLAIGDE